MLVIRPRTFHGWMDGCVTPFHVVMTCKGGWGGDLSEGPLDIVQEGRPAQTQRKLSDWEKDDSIKDGQLCPCNVAAPSHAMQCYCATQ
jgi:hypothetical protein